jgi:hypothetical protein
LQVANVTALLPLKSKAWLDLTRRKAAGEAVDSKNITKHRNDIFRLAATLPGEPGPELPTTITADLVSFLATFPMASEEWVAILASLKEGIGPIRAETLRGAIQTYFRLTTIECPPDEAPQTLSGRPPEGTGVRELFPIMDATVSSAQNSAKGSVT